MTKDTTTYSSDSRSEKNGLTLEMNPETGLKKVSNMEKQLEQQTETVSSMFDVKLRQGCGEFLTKVTKDAAVVVRVVLCVGGVLQ